MKSLSEEPKVRRDVHGNLEFLNPYSMKWEPLGNVDVKELIERNPKLAKEFGYDLKTQKDEAKELTDTLNRIERVGLDLSADEIRHFKAKADRILKRTIRGMLPYKKQRGQDALKRVKVYLGEPSEFEGQEAETIEDAKIGQIERKKYLELGKLSEHIGG